ncbi:MtrAB system histidine kinase MtrB [Nocardioides speluncae]|uniref:MtrAB system histidine kinase MtrB n=1 Tax=Nocardioides speluncae TaxID=2670337 RepID=UPI000D693AC6|nr:MtrAB system histidine kinase MtrB [Nocardioides speluncae]
MVRTSIPTAVRRGLTFWQRSIQARVVVSTVLLTAIVVTLVGWFLLQQTRDGLLENKVESAVGEANVETDLAKQRLEALPGTDTDVARQQEEVFDSIDRVARNRGFGAVLAGPGQDDTDLRRLGARMTSVRHLEAVPLDLRQHFQTSDTTVWTYGSVPAATSGDPTPGIVVGSRIQLPADGQFYTIYYLFPLTEERETLSLVSRALITAGGALLLLIAGVTWLVARQVVTPVRLARQVAERLASGKLEERLRIRGHDDIARLGTSFNQMASNLQRQIGQLEELSRMQRRFVSDVSHELRTPLTTVRMASDVLHDARGSFDPATARAAELLQTELDRFERLLGDLLEISRFDAGAAALEVVDVNLVDLCRRIVDATGPLAARCGVQIVVHAPDGPCLVEADVRRVERIVRNLVSNAIDHSDSGDIEIYVASNDDASAIAVRDHGIGLEAGQSALVFNRFWRADPARARTSGGTGLGLSIALEDTHLHGGWLQAWGQPGDGAQFRLTLPRRSSGSLRHSPLPLVPADAKVPA